MIVESEVLCDLKGISHGFGTREGGVSQGIYASLNCGVGSKDNQNHVAENRARLAARVGASPDALATPYQTHSPDVAVAEKPWTRADTPKADAVVTVVPGLAIAVSTADCVPVLFADPEAQVVGAAHAGWRGALSGVLEATLNAMEKLGATRGRITASVGPAISQRAYEVGEEFEDTFLASDPANARFFKRETDDAKPHFDLTGYVTARLEAVGAGRTENLGLCTYYDSARFFSYRRSCHESEPDYGRQISAILIAR